MRILVRLHGGLRRHTSPGPVQVDVRDDATAADVIAALNLRPGEVWLVTLNDELIDVTYPLQPEDELSLIPPVGGGL